MKSIDFSRNLIKGKIAEVVFEQMFRETGEFTILRLGYEHTSPELAQYQKYFAVKKVIENLRHASDFLLISQDKTRVFVVEVKFMAKRNSSYIKQFAKTALKFADPSWLFVASPDGFYFEPCNNVYTHNGKIKKLEKTWVPSEIQTKYQQLLNEFEK